MHPIPPQIDRAPSAGASPPPTIHTCLSDHPAVSGGATTFFVLSHLVVAIILWVAIRAALIHVFLRYGEAAEYVGLVVFIALYLLAVRALMNRRAAAEEKAASALPFEEQVLREVARLPSAIYPFGLAALASRLAKAGHRNLIICLERVPTERPIEVLFEPIAIEDCGAAALSEDWPAAIPDARSARSTRYQLARNARVLGWKLPAMFAYMMFCAAIFGAKWGRGDRFGAAEFLAVQLAIVLILILSNRGNSAWEWYVMPCGLMSRSRSHYARRHSQQFRRQDCVSVVYRHSYRCWGIIVANVRETNVMLGTQTEIDFAVRALCSPLPPPPAESIEASG